MAAERGFEWLPNENRGNVPPRTSQWFPQCDRLDSHGDGAVCLGTRYSWDSAAAQSAGASARLCACAGGGCQWDDRWWRVELPWKQERPHDRRLVSFSLYSSWMLLVTKEETERLRVPESLSASDREQRFQWAGPTDAAGATGNTKHTGSLSGEPAKRQGGLNLPA